MNNNYSRHISRTFLLCCLAQIADSGCLQAVKRKHAAISDAASSSASSNEQDAKRARPAEVEEKKFITLTSSDGQECIVEENIAKRFKVVRGLLEDLYVGNDDQEAIPLPAVSGRVLENILSLTHQAAQLETQNIEHNKIVATLAGQLSEAVRSNIFEYLQAVDYLDCELLAEALIHHFVQNNDQRTIIQQLIPYFYPQASFACDIENLLVQKIQARFVGTLWVELASFPHGRWPESAVFNRDETRILTTTITTRASSRAYLWDVNNPDQPLATFPHPSLIINSAVFNRDETRILAGADNSAYLWDVNNPAQPPATFSHDNHIVASAAFNRDETRILTRSGKNAYLWDVNNPNQPLAIFPHGDWVSSAVFNRDETRIQTASSIDATAKLWGGLNLNLAQTFFILLLDLAQREGAAMNFEAIAERYKFIKDGFVYLSKDHLQDIWRSLPKELQAEYRTKYNLQENVVEPAADPQNSQAQNELINWLQGSNTGENQ